LTDLSIIRNCLYEITFFGFNQIDQIVTVHNVFVIVVILFGPKRQLIMTIDGAAIAQTVAMLDIVSPVDN
jgi:hypothetical protein